jgi:hypothetical protein
VRGTLAGRYGDELHGSICLAGEAGQGTDDGLLQPVRQPVTGGFVEHADDEVRSVAGQEASIPTCPSSWRLMALKLSMPLAMVGITPT